jgi:cytochrome d ubiquinol oxidase subunit I
MKILALNFARGVVTGKPMEFQFGTNWAKFSELTGGIVCQTLAMEGMFSFFLESSGQPNVEEKRWENKIAVPHVLRF